MLSVLSIAMDCFIFFFSVYLVYLHYSWLEFSVAPVIIAHLALKRRCVCEWLWASNPIELATLVRGGSWA